MPSSYVPSSVASALLLKQKKPIRVLCEKKKFHKERKGRKDPFLLFLLFYLYLLSCYLIIEIFASGSPSILVSP